jgi:hypothetical protein
MSSNCRKCAIQNSIVQTNQNSVQKKLQNQVLVPQSLYSSTKSCLNTYVNNNNEGKKHNSYERYLLKKKGKVISQQGKKIDVPSHGNKTKSLSLTSHNKNCNLCN